jgi:hypothetical protein
VQLPEMFFDVALLWQPNGEMKRRQTGPCDSRRLFVSSPCVPSWSRAGWIGPIDPWSWQSGSNFVKQGDLGAQASRETIPTTRWYASISPSSRDRREIGRKWYTYKDRHRDLNLPPPEGWTRHLCPVLAYGHTTWNYPDCPPPEGFGSCFYTHVSSPSHQFWYPIPIHKPGTTPTIRNPAAFLFSTV